VGVVRPLVVNNATIDVVSLVPVCSTITLAKALLLEGGPEVHQPLAVLVDHGLKLAELL
jgi:hypothetical protein